MSSRRNDRDIPLAETLTQMPQRPLRPNTAPTVKAAINKTDPIGRGLEDGGATTCRRRAESPVVDKQSTLAPQDDGRLQSGEFVTSNCTGLPQNLNF